MTLDPAARQVRHRLTVPPSPTTSGVDFHVDADTGGSYFWNAPEQTVPLKLTVYPENEMPTKDNSEVILVTAYTAGTRAGTVKVVEVAAGGPPGGPVDVQEQQLGDPTIPQTEIQVLTVDATTGTYTLSFNGSTTAAINWNDNAATIQTRLRALASIGGTNVNVTGTGPFTITFASAMANQAQPLITANASSLDTGGAGGVVVTELVHGSGAANEVQLVTVTADTGEFTLTFGGNTTDPLPENATSDAVSTELQALASIGSGNVDVQGEAGGPFTVTFQGALGLAAQALITADGSLLVTGGVNATHSVTVDGDGGTFKLSLDGVNFTGALAAGSSAATVQTALQALAAIGANNCSVEADPDLRVYTVTFIGALANTTVALLTSDVSALTMTTAHITAATRAQDGTTARDIQSGDHIEAALVTPGLGRSVGFADVFGTAAETSILAAPVTIVADTLQTRLVRCTWLGTHKSNQVNIDVPRFKFYLGGSLIFDTNITGSPVISPDATGWPLRFTVELFSLPGSNTVYAHMDGCLVIGTLNTTGGANFLTGDGKVRTVAAGSAGGEAHYKGVNSVSIDPTVDNDIDFKVIHPSSSGQIETSQFTAVVEVI